MKKEIKVPWRLFLSLLIFGGLFVSMVWLVAVLPASAMPDAARQTAAAVPQAPMADPVWCVAGGFQSPNVWDLDDSPLYDDGTHGDIVAGDGVFSLDYEIASAGRYEFKVLTCGDWGTAFPYANSWLNTTAVNESVKFTFDTNNHSSDAGPALAPAQNIVNVWDSSSFIAVGDVVGWDNTATANALVNVGNGVYVFTATVPTAGAHEGKIVSASTWDTVTANGRIAGDTGSGNYGYTTTSDNQSVIYYLDTKTGRMGIFPQGSTSGNWCVAGGFQSPNEWDNNDNPLYDDGTHGDLIGGDGVFSLDYVIAANGRYEMKALTCGDWDSPNYPSDNAWVVTANNDQTVKFTFDTNNHSSDAGLKLMPAQYIVNAWDSTPNAFTVVGSWQGWNNPSMDTDMSNAGNNYHVVSANFATAGNYEAKLSQTGNWDNQFAADGRRAGRSDGPPPVGFTVWNDGDDVQFYLDANQGRWAIIAPPSGGASQDGLIVMDALGHDSRDALYRTPGGPVITGTAVTLRLRAAMNDLTGAKVRVYNDLTNAEFFLNMTKSASDGTYDYWQATIPATVDSTLFWYRFIAVDGATTAYYEDDASRDGGWGKASTTSQDNSWQLTVYDPSFQTPDWAKNAVIYQIFPDRFRDGDVTNDPAPGRFFYDELDGTIYRSDPLGGTGNPWNEVVCNPRDAADCLGTYSLNFYGGDLQGVRDKLQYLQDLGITTIYFNPIFESPSNHKYDTGNYYDIASDFGDLQTFITLTTEAHNLGMYVILDGVFNHTSSDSMFFDRYSRFDANGDLTSPDGPGVNDDSGACESPDSPYRSWYYFTDVAAGTGDCAGSDGTPLAANYESWFGYDSLPKLNSANPGVRDMIFAGGPDSVAVQWLQYADGWRFDVGGDIDPGHTNAPTNLFWEEFRDTVRAEYPDTYMVIEEWGNASPWLLGNEMDATMNYQYGAAMLSFWRDTTFTDNDHNSGSSVGELKPLKPSELNGRLLNWIERYPPEALYAMMNLLDSHDTNRALFLLDDNAADANDDTLLQNPNYDWSNALARLRGVAILQMTLPGAPTIYYGDEVGLVGPTYYSGGKWEDDPYNRQPYPWLETGLGTPFYTFLQSQSNQDAMYDYYANLTSARNSHEALRLGSFDPLLIDDTNMIYAYGRKMADNSDAALVFVNRDGTLASPIDHTVALTVAGYIPYGAEFTDVMSGNSYTVDGNGVITVEVPGESGAVLVLDSMLVEAPAAVTDLAVTAEGNATVDLGWTAVSGNVTYHVYRSLTSGGGYELIGSTDSLSYNDTGLQNATTYYYVVVVEDKDTGLLSDQSNEVFGQPQFDLTTAWYNLQWPYEITHTISTITPTENIYGQLYIAGFTGPDGPAAGIRAQVGYGPVADAPTNPSWQWTEMSYDSADGNNDQYVGKLLPDMVGEFLFSTRWSSNNGQTWYYSVDKDAGFVGDLHVVASADSTAPAATTLYLDGTTAGSISLSWELNSEPDMAGYELYRQDVSMPGYVKIATTAVITSYVDTDVTTGTTYEYYIKAFDTSFNRSPASNIVEATAEARFVTVTFQVAVPDYTPGTVYIVGDLGEWGPWNPGKTPMTQVGSTNVWTYTTTILDGTQIQYKYTRATWEMVESWGSIIALNNRHLTISYGTNGTMLVDNTSTDWGNGPDDNKAVQTWRDPIVIAYGPVGSDVAVGTAVTTTWSIAMNPGSAFSVVGPAGAVAGTFALTNDSHDLTFTPDAALNYSTTYTVTVSGLVGSSSAGAESGTQQVPVTWQFITEPFTLWFPIMFKN